MSPNLLDDADALGDRDPNGALAALASVPEQVRDALRAAEAIPAERLPGPRSVQDVVVCGMGGSAAGGDAIAAAAREAGDVPVWAHRDYGLPAWCSPRTFVIASSYSGETEETLDSFRAAVDAGCRGVAVTSGGTLGERAHAAGWPVGRVGAGLMPRYALGWVTALPAAILVRCSLLDGAWREGLPGTLDHRALECGPGRLGSENPAKQIARALADVLPVVWGSDGATGVAAARFAKDLNENAKIPAHAAALPEADHNEIVGWAREGADGRPGGRCALVLLREPDEHPRIAARFEATRAEVEASFEEVVEVRARGDDPLTRFCDLALLGGYASVYLALLRGVDPTPIDSIARLKAGLAQRP